MNIAKISFGERAKIFTQRLDECMKNKHYNNTTLSKALNTGTNRNTIKNWKTYDDKNPDSYSFPLFNNIVELADVLNVDVGYLLGETDYSSVEIEKVCKYTGLSEKAINSLIMITGTDKKSLDFGYESEQYRHILNSLFTSPAFLVFIARLNDLASIYDNANNVWMNTEKSIGDKLSNEGLNLYQSTTDYENDPAAPELSPEQIDAYKKTNSAIDGQYNLSYIEKVARYELHEAFENLIESIYPRKNY